MNLTDIIGWIGSICILAAFGLNSFQKIKSNSLSFQLLNLIGGICLIINSIAHQAYPFTFINSVWSVISIIALLKMVIKRKPE